MGIRQDQKQHLGGLLACTGGFVLFAAMIVTIVMRSGEITTPLPFILTGVLGAVGVFGGILILKNITLGVYVAIGCGILNYVGNFIPIDSLTLTLSLSTLNLAALFLIIGGILGVVYATKQNSEFQG